MDISVVIPTLNEKKSLEILLPELIQVLEKSNFLFEIIVVDDRSGDGTDGYLRQLKDARIHFMIRKGAKGLASAIVDGASWAKSDLIGVMDGDGQHSPEDFLKMLLEFKSNDLDLIVGSRNLTYEAKKLTLTKSRLQLSLVANAIARFILKRNISDPMSGFFIVKRQYIDQYGFILYKDGFKILFDLLFQVRNNVLKIHEIQIDFRERLYGNSKLNLDIFIEFLVDVLSKFIGGFVSHRFIKFSIVGGTGIFVHLASLYIGLTLGVEFFNAQAIAIGISLSINYLFNNLFTFNDEILRGFNLCKGYIKYLSVNVIGAIANVGVASALYGQQGSLFAALAGILVGTTFNYVFSKFFVWNRV